MVSNTTAIAEALSRIDHKFDLMYPRELSSTGMSEKVWKKVSSPRLVRILLPLKRITKKLVPKLLKVRVKKRTSVRNIKLFNILTNCYSLLKAFVRRQFLVMNNCM